MKKLLSSDPISGKKTYFQSDVDGHSIVLEQETQPVLDYAKESANDWRYGSLIGNTQKHQQHVAEFPAVIYYDLLSKFGQPKDNPKAWKKWLEENKAFKVTGGTLV